MKLRETAMALTAATAAGTLAACSGGAPESTPPTHTSAASKFIFLAEAAASDSVQAINCSSSVTSGTLYLPNPRIGSGAEVTVTLGVTDAKIEAGTLRTLTFLGGATIYAVGGTRYEVATSDHPDMATEVDTMHKNDRFEIPVDDDQYSVAVSVQAVQPDGVSTATITCDKPIDKPDLPNPADL